MSHQAESGEDCARGGQTHAFLCGHLNPDAARIIQETSVNGNEYDVIIVGASFAGLAVASRLRGRVLLIDRKGIGEGQTSACATLLPLVLRLAGPEAVLQVHTEAVVHIARLRIRYSLVIPLCTFDYRVFCQNVVRRTQAQFLQAEVLGTNGATVFTDHGVFRGHYLVDASGWRAILANSLSESFRREQRLAFGLESEATAKGNSLDFWLDGVGARESSYGWSFPCGSFSRVGWGGCKTSGLKKRVAALAETLGVRLGGLHGGFLSYGFHDPAEGGVFLVGDAAGQCLPLTGEGIRPAVYFGQRCGDILQDILEGRLTREQGVEEYRRIAASVRTKYAALERAQWNIHRSPLPVLMLWGWLASVTPLGRRSIARYQRAFPMLPERPVKTPSPTPATERDRMMTIGLSPKRSDQRGCSPACACGRATLQSASARREGLLPIVSTRWDVKKKLLPLTIALAALTVVACAAPGAPAQGASNAERGGGQQTGGVSQSASLATLQTSKQGPVTVEARLSDAHAAGDTGPLVFSIVLDTHSVDLDAIDLAKSTVLRDDRGRSVAAMRWEAPPGGHHVQGVLTFPGALSDGSALHGPSTRSLTLVVTNIGDVPERRLTWDLAAESPANRGS